MENHLENAAHKELLTIRMAVGKLKERVQDQKSRFASLLKPENPEILEDFELLRRDLEGFQATLEKLKPKSTVETPILPRAQRTEEDVWTACIGQWRSERGNVVEYTANSLSITEKKQVVGGLPEISRLEKSKHQKNSVIKPVASKGAYNREDSTHIQLYMKDGSLCHLHYEAERGRQTDPEVFKRFAGV